MQRNRLDTLRGRLPGMLNGVGVYREAVYFPVFEIAVFPRKNFPEAGPAARRRFHIAVSLAVGFWKQPSTSNADGQLHLP